MSLLVVQLHTPGNVMEGPEGEYASICIGPVGVVCRFCEEFHLWGAIIGKKEEEER